MAWYNDLAKGIEDTVVKGGSKTAGKYLKNNYTTAIMLILAGVIVGSFGIPAIPALGIPHITASWIGMALIMYGFYNVIPSKSQILNDIRWADRWKCPFSTHPTLACTESSLINTPRKLSNPPKTDGPHEQVYMEPVDSYMLLEGKHYGWLYMKSFLKILAISFAALEFSPLSVFPFKNILIPIIFLFYMYFTMPTGYKKSEPYKAAEAWFRMVLGFVLALLVMTFLTPNPTIAFTGVFWTQFVLLLAGVIIIGIISLFGSKLSDKTWLVTVLVGLIFIFSMPVLGAYAGTAMNMPGVSAFYLMLAFFTAMPERKEEEEGDEKVKINVKIINVAKISETMDNLKKGWNIFGTIIFLVFALAGGIPVFGWAGGGQSLQIAYGIVWILAILMGIVGGRESRPYLGVIVMILTIISFSFAYSSTLGAAIFGSYWGTIEHTGEVFFGPIASQMDRASCDAYANYQCISSDPITCKNAKLDCQKKLSDLQGSDRSIEITSFIPAPKEIGLDASDHVANTTVYMTIENTGTYVAKDVKVYIAGSKDEYPKFKYVENRETTKHIGDTEVQSCLGGDYAGGNTCQWTGDFKPGSKGIINFVIDWTKGDDQFPSELNEWTYYYGLYPEIKITTSFDYHVDSQYASHIRSSEEMTKLLQAGGDEAGTVSRYTGGPMIASIWMPQYVESGKTTFLTAALTNSKEGTATAASTCLYVPKWAGTLTRSSGEVRDGAPDCVAPASDTNVVECYWDKIKSVTSVVKSTNKIGQTQTTGEPDNSGDCTFKLTPDSGGVPNKEILIIGNTTFHYAIDEIRKSIPIMG